jgi:hypothetical protein
MTADTPDPLIKLLEEWNAEDAGDTNPAPGDFPKPDPVAVGEGGVLPADIAAAIEAFEDWFREEGIGQFGYDEVRYALNAAILARLAAVEAERDHFRDKLGELHACLRLAEGSSAELRARLSAAEAARDEACARAERVEKLTKLLADAQPTVARHGYEITLYCPDGTITNDLYDALEAASYGPALASPAPVEGEGRTERLEKALEPFAAWMDKLDVEFGDHEDDVIAGGVSTAVVTFGDLRRARAALAAERKE